jgi:hypothetical protein
MAAPVWLKEAIKWIAFTFGKDIVLLAKDFVEHQWQRIFASRNILVLGTKQTGKTSLALYLQHGHPYEVVEGEIRAPNPTAFAAVVDKKFALQQKNWLRLKKDVPGDLDLRAIWTQAIKDLRPHGIIYMIDGRLPDNELRREVADGIGEHVLTHYKNGLRELIVLHVFANFADQWSDSPATARAKERVITDAFEDIIRHHGALRHLRFSVASIQLSPNKKSWEDTKRALHRFGADLME